MDNVELVKKFLNELKETKTETEVNDLFQKYQADYEEEDYNNLVLTLKKINFESHISQINRGELKCMMNACYNCKYRGNVPGDAHSQCMNHNALVQAEEHGIRSGWFFWPLNFDPTWLIYCDGFVDKKEEN